MDLIRPLVLVWQVVVYEPNCIPVCMDEAEVVLSVEIEEKYNNLNECKSKKNSINQLKLNLLVLLHNNPNGCKVFF